MLRRSSLAALALALPLFAAACSQKRDPITITEGTVNVENQTSREWRNVMVTVNDHFRGGAPRLASGGRLTAPLSQFQTAFGQRFKTDRQSVFKVEVTATDDSGEPVKLQWAIRGADAIPEDAMKLASEFETTCPCCHSTLVIDGNLRRVVRHEEPPSANRPELGDAHRLVAEEAERREAMFQQSVAAEKTRGDALSRRFEEALRQAKDEPIIKPTRDFDLD